MADEEYTVGYKRPPKGGQFKPGQSGNPRGRPKGSVSFKADLAAEMRERITVKNGNGKPLRLTKQRALIKLLFSLALNKEKSAISTLLAYMRYFGTDDVEPVVDAVDLDDLDIVENYLNRERQRRVPSNQPSPLSDKGKK